MLERIVTIPRIGKMLDSKFSGRSEQDSRKLMSKTLSGVCYNCGAERTYLSSHWNGKSCDYPRLTKNQYNTVIGCLMGDGHVDNNRLHVTNTNLEYLRSLIGDLGFLFGKIIDNPTPKGSKDAYALITRTHPMIGNLRGWYESGEKVYPKRLKLTPTIAKHWYCGDGSLGRTKDSYRCIFTATQQSGMIETIVKWFRSEGFRCTYSDMGRIYISVKDTPQFLNWMGKPPAGMEYKWEIGQ